MTAEPCDFLGRFFDIGAEQVAPIFRVEPRGEFRRANEVAEHHRDQATFGVVARRTRRRRRQTDDGGLRHLGDRFAQPLPVAKRDAELRQIVLGQIREDVHVDRLVAKSGFVALQTQIAQPRAKFHGVPLKRAPTLGATASYFSTTRTQRFPASSCRGATEFQSCPSPFSRFLICRQCAAGSGDASGPKSWTSST